MSPRKRVLVLHGWTQNARLFKETLEPFCRECEGRGIELVFLDGPHGVNVDEIIESYVLNPEVARDMGVDPEAPGLKEELEKTDPRTWWDYNKDRSLALGIGETLNVVRGALEKQRFDGVFGFSQGAALAAIISALLERPEVYPGFIHEGKPIHPPLQFCIAVSGFRLIDPVVARIFSTSIKTPVMHIIGTKDQIVRSVRSQPLIDLSENKRVIVHEDAHIVPLTATWTAFYCDFIQGSSFDIPAPVPAVENLKL